MGTRGIAVMGRLSRVQMLALAVLAVSVGLLLANAKPAQAEGETWYGTVEMRGTGQPYHSEGATTVNRSVVRYEAPTDTNYASFYTKNDVTITYQDPFPDGPGCYLAQVKEYGTVSGTGEIVVGPQDANNNEYWVSLRTKSITNHQAWASYDYEECDSNRDYTVSEVAPWNSTGTITSTQNSQRYFRVGEITDNDPNGCGAGLAECADLSSRGSGVTAKWSLSANPCSGHSGTWNIGGSDKLVLFNPCQAKSLSSRLSVFDDITGQPEVCKYAFSLAADNVGTKLASKLNKLCDAYKAVLRVQWLQVRWFAFNAAQWDGCAVWVVDDASWRPPKIRSAIRDSDGLGVAWIPRGTTETIRTANGPFPVTC